MFSLREENERAKQTNWSEEKEDAAAEKQANDF